MLHPVTVRTLAFAACGWLLAAEASALTLGRVRGAALVGRPLEVSIPATLDGTEGDACAEADVFYGEQKVVRQPTVRWQSGANRQGVLHVSSELPVDEPVVTIYLRVGCGGQAVTRRFVLLAELPPTNGPSAPVTVPVQPAPAPVPRAPAPAPEPAPRVAAPAPGPAARPPPAAAPATARPAPPPPARAAAPRSSRREAAGERQDRLKLDLLDLTTERSPALRLSPQLQAVPTTDAQARASAAALWAALQRSPEEILQDAQRQQALERDLQSLRVQTQQNAAEVGKMRAQVEKSRTDRQQSSLLLVALLVVLAALAAAMGWLWWRARRLDNVRRWFDTPREPPVTAPGPAVPPPKRGAGAPAAAAAGPVSAPVPIGQAAAAAIAQATPSGWGTLPNAEFQPSQGGTIRMVGVQELIDVHDKADFFFALGQHDQAIEILESHVHDQVETSALAWMDLLEQYHKLDRRADFERLRAEFRQRFAVQVPDFDHFDQPTSSLENYGRALSRIVALWPSRRVLNVIEESIFRKPGLPGAEPFSLEAYRELVLLYNIAKDVAPEEDSVSAPLEYRATDFPATSLQPLSTLDVADRPAAARAEPTIVQPRPYEPSAAAPLDLTPPPAASGPEPVPEATVVMGQHDGEPPPERERLLIPPSSPRIGLDIDLDAPDPGAPAAAPGPQRELPPLDFDTSEYDHWNTHDPGDDLPPRR